MMLPRSARQSSARATSAGYGSFFFFFKQKTAYEMGGVPVVLRDAPLGTYLGWNITDGRGSPPLAQFRPFHKDQNCDYVGGMIPFAKTKAERLASGDPRLSLEERYKDHAGYVDAVMAAAANAVAQGFLLQEDATALIGLATTSAVLNP